MKLNPFIFDSKKATILTVVLAFIAFIKIALPALMPTVPVAVFDELAQFFTELAMFYLGTQGAVDIVKVLKPKA